MNHRPLALRLLLALALPSVALAQTAGRVAPEAFPAGAELYGATGVWLADDVEVEGGRVGAAGGLTLGRRVAVDGDVFGHQITLGVRSVVRGRATAVAGARLALGARVEGGIDGRADALPTVEAPRGEVELRAGADVRVQGWQTLAPGRYGAVQVEAGGTLFLKGGRLDMGRLTIAPGGQVRVAYPTRIHADGLFVGAGAWIDPMFLARGPEDVRLVVGGAAVVSIGDRAVVGASLSAPDALVILGAHAHWSGSLYAHRIMALEGARIALAPGCRARPEGCEGEDDDCDGLADEGLVAPDAARQDGLCAGALDVCAGFSGWQAPDYAAIEGFEADEAACDGADNDCDGLVDEVIGRDPAHCLGCGRGCEVAGGTGACVDADCVIADCAPGWWDHDGDFATGCELRCEVDPVDRVDADGDGVCDPPAPPDPCAGDGCVFTEVASGAEHNCGLRADGTVLCWGSPALADWWRVPEAVQGGFVAVAAGYYHTCGIRGPERRAVCWGRPDEGVTAPPPEAVGLRAIAAGDLHTCALTEPDGRVLCWGRAFHNPVDPPEDGGYTGIVAGQRHTCAIAEVDGRARCWGDSIAQSPLSVPRDDADGYRALAIGHAHACGIKAADGRVVCWGGYDETLWTPPPGEEAGYVELVAGDRFTCGARVDGRVVCWGVDILDNGATRPPDAPGLAGLSAGYHHTCALRADGRAICWGGRGSGMTVPPPLDDFVAIDAGRRHACGIRGAEGEVVCWGSDREGQATPPPGVRAGFIAISAGTAETCGLLAPDGRVVCWGATAPVVAGPEPNGGYVALDLEGYRPCAVHESGRVDCWSSGALWTLPDDVDEGVVDVTVSASFGCALRGDGRVSCWGRGIAGPADPLGFTAIDATASGVAGIQRGRVAVFGFIRPGEQPQPDGEGYVSVAGGHGHACALHAEGHVDCWGTDLVRAVTRPPAPPPGGFSAITADLGYACGIVADGGRVMCWGTNGHGAGYGPTEGWPTP